MTGIIAKSQLSLNSALLLQSAETTFFYKHRPLTRSMFIVKGQHRILDIEDQESFGCENPKQRNEDSHIREYSLRNVMQ